MTIFSMPGVDIIQDLLSCVDFFASLLTVKRSQIAWYTRRFSIITAINYRKVTKLRHFHSQRGLVLLPSSSGSEAEHLAAYPFVS